VDEDNSNTEAEKKVGGGKWKGTSTIKNYVLS